MRFCWIEESNGEMEIVDSPEETIQEKPVLSVHFPKLISTKKPYLDVLIPKYSAIYGIEEIEPRFPFGGELMKKHWDVRIVGGLLVKVLIMILIALEQLG